MDLEEVVTRAIEILFKYLSFSELFALGPNFFRGFTSHQDFSFYLMGWILHISHE
jgi:hypothetical protein